MKLNVESYSDVIAMIAGLFQFKENEQFTQTALAVTENEILFYDDNAPDRKEGEEYYYQVKKRLSLDDITMVVDEKITKCRQLNNLGRLNFLSQDEDKAFVFYYFISDKKDVQSFCKELASLGIKTKKKKVNLGQIKF